jgi:hypothetical protein
MSAVGDDNRTKTPQPPPAQLDDARKRRPPGAVRTRRRVAREKQLPVEAAPRDERQAAFDIAGVLNGLNGADSADDVLDRQLSKTSVAVSQAPPQLADEAGAPPSGSEVDGALGAGTATDGPEVPADDDEIRQAIERHHQQARPAVRNGAPRGSAEVPHELGRTRPRVRSAQAGAGRRKLTGRGRIMVVLLVAAVGAVVGVSLGSGRDRSAAHSARSVGRGAQIVRAATTVQAGVHADARAVAAVATAYKVVRRVLRAWAKTEAKAKATARTRAKANAAAARRRRDAALRAQQAAASTALQTTSTPASSGYTGTSSGTGGSSPVVAPVSSGGSSSSGSASSGGSASTHQPILGANGTLAPGSSKSG